MTLNGSPRSRITGSVERTERNIRHLSGVDGSVLLPPAKEIQLLAPFGSRGVHLLTGNDVDGGTLISPRSAWLRSPGAEARLEWSGPAEVIIVGFTAKSLDDAAAHLRLPAAVLREGGTSDPVVLNIASMVRDAFTGPRESPRLVAASATSLLAIRLVTLAGRMSPDTRREQLSPTALKRVLGFIESHLVEDFDLDQMARAAGCSRFHFARAFRSCTGISPWKYVTRRRLRQAETLLRTERSLSVAEVCHMVGFQDQSHFTRAFKSAFSVTPGSFRRQMAGTN